ncbi:MAG: hypothetical protein DMG00_04055, partial [Acidobacteria bacterium]
MQIVLVGHCNSSGNVVTLHGFTSSDGAYPSTAVIQGSEGLLYGTTAGGGASFAGTVFRMDTSGALTTLHMFANVDGAHPNGALVQASDGSFYGTTAGGDPNLAGTVYR